MKQHSIFAFISVTAILVVTALQAQTDFTFVGDQPVLDPGDPGKWDDFSLDSPGIVLDGDTLRMWYTGFDNPRSIGGSLIGYAWSLDGVTWNRYAGNPVLTITLSWERNDFLGSTVRKEGDTFRMWYGRR